MKRFNSNYLNKLKSNVDSNKEYYYEAIPFIEGYEKIDISNVDEAQDRVKLKTQAHHNEKLDFENSKILFSDLFHLTPSEAADEKMWAYMTHVTHWDYMRTRWPIEKTTGNKGNFILDRYFFKAKPISRNGLARLWWGAHITYNEKYENPFYLTSIMMEGEDQDIAKMILESPTICRNRKMVEATLISLKELKEQFNIKSREYIRYAARYINLTGSVTLWEFLDDEELRGIINEMKQKWRDTHVLESVK